MLKKIEFGKLIIGQTAKKHLKDVCDTNWASSGPKVKLFEKSWGELFGYKHNVAMSSGTDACIQACLSLYRKGAKPGDQVIVPALSFIATSNAVRAAGFEPVFVDIKKETLNIDESKIEEAVTDKTRAIMVVHTMGKPCNMKVVCNIAEKHGLDVIEDACEAHGAKFQGKYVGDWGSMACFSFYTAHLVCCGEGGMLSFNADDSLGFVNSTQSHGRSGVYFDHPNFGLNSKMNDMEASLGLEGLQNFWSTFNTRKDTISILRNRLSRFEDLVWFSEEDKGDTNCPHGFSITFKHKDLLRMLTQDLEEASIHWKRNFGCIPTQHGAFSHLNYSMGDFPNAEWVGDNGIHIGVHQYLSQSDIEYIGDTLEKSLENIR